MRNFAGHKVLLILRNPGGTCRNIYGREQLYPPQQTLCKTVLYYHLCANRNHIMLEWVCMHDGNTHVLYDAVFCKHFLCLIRYWNNKMFFVRNYWKMRKCLWIRGVILDIHSVCCMLHAGIMLTLQPWTWRRHVPPEILFTLSLEHLFR
jgi:hypothetical protein